MGLFDLFKSKKGLLVVDGLALNEALGMKGKVPPRTQLQVLRRLARFAQREKLELVVVLSGSPLHKAPANKKFEELLVVYSKSAEDHAAFLLKTTQSKGNGSILISNNETTDKCVSRVKTMRISTFRKAFDFGGNDIEGGERFERKGGGNNNGRNNARRRSSGSSKSRSEKPAKSEKKPAPEKEKKVNESDAINELIDLID